MVIQLQPTTSRQKHVYHGHHHHHLQQQLPKFTTTRRINPRRAFPLFTPLTKLTHPVAQRLLNSTDSSDDLANNEDSRSFLSLQLEAPQEPIQIPVNHTQIITNGDDGVDVFGSQLSRIISLPSAQDITEFGKSPAPDHMNWLVGEHTRRYSTVKGDDDRILATTPLTHDRIETNYGSIPKTVEITKASEYDMLINKVKNNRFQFQSQSQQKSSIKQTDMQSVISQESSIDEEIEDFAHEKITKFHELSKLMNYSIPLIITFVLDQSFQFFSIILVGQLGTNELAAISLSTMVINIIFSIFEGIATALDTLCPQSYGSGDLRGVGLHFQRCTLLSLVIFAPVSLIWWFSGELLSFIVNDPEVIQLTCTYQKITLISLPGFIIFETLKRYLQAQGIFEAATYVLMFTTPFNCIVAYVLVWHFQMGFIGAAIACNLNAWSQFIMLALYAAFIDGYQCWFGFSKRALHHWDDLMELSLPGIVMFLIEAFLYEIMTLIASNFGTKYLAIQTTATTITSLLYTIPFSSGIATSTRIANFIGARRIDAAKSATNIGMSTAVFIGLFNSLIVILFPLQIAELFSQDPHIIELSVQILPLVGLTQFFDAMNSVAGGCLRGQGMQRIGSIVNLIGYCVIGIPCGWLLSYHYGLKLFGLWYTNGIVLVFIGGVQSWFAFRADWETVLQEADERRELELEYGIDVELYN